jgi:hypothetical protein
MTQKKVNPPKKNPSFHNEPVIQFSERIQHQTQISRNNRIKTLYIIIFPFFLRKRIPFADRPLGTFCGKVIGLFRMMKWQKPQNIYTTISAHRIEIYAYIIVYTVFRHFSVEQSIFHSMNMFNVL